MRSELKRSILRTLQREAIASECAIADARLVALSGLVVVELWLILGDTLLGGWVWPLAGLTLAMLVWALLLRRWLRADGWHPLVPLVVPTVDAAYFGLRQGGTMAVLGVTHFVDVQDLATVIAAAALLIVSGAMRLSTRAVLYSTALGLTVYFGFALASSVSLFFMTIHLSTLAALGVVAAGLTRVVDRAVHSEITRLTLGRLLPASVLEAAHDDPLALLTEPRSLDATVVVTDLRGFTRWAERRPPFEVLSFLNVVQGALAGIVDAHGGTVDKFMGDGMLAVFGAPNADPEHADRALRAVRAMLTYVAELDDADVQLGVGVHSGELVVGCLGSGPRMEFTILGDTVNVASRLEGMTKELGEPVLISAETATRASQLLRGVGRLSLRGRDAPMQVFGVDVADPGAEGQAGRSSEPSA